MAIHSFRRLSVAVIVAALAGSSSGCIDQQIKARDRATDLAATAFLRSLMQNIRVIEMELGRAPTIADIQAKGAIPAEARGSVITPDDVEPRNGYQGYVFVYLMSDDGRTPAYAIVGKPTVAGRALLYCSSGSSQIRQADSDAVEPPLQPYPDDRLPADWR